MMLSTLEATSFKNNTLTLVINLGYQPFYQAELLIKFFPSTPLTRTTPPTPTTP
ncbi:MAG: hypothetical protein ACSHW0_11125 [Thalassotalea sp.]